MLQSPLIKLGMLAATLGLVWWIGWKLPDPGYSEAPPAVAPAEIPRTLAAAPETFTDATPAAPAREPRRAQAHAAKEGRQDRNPQLDLNKATAEQLERLPGIGSVLAQRVIEHRRSVGGFHRVDDLLEVKGIGAKKFERIRALVTVTPPAATQPPAKRTT